MADSVQSWREKVNPSVHAQVDKIISDFGATHESASEIIEAIYFQSGTLE